MIKVDNAIIMAAGTASRFAPLSYETHKGLIKVKGEVLIERQIRQLKEAGINQIIIVVGYKAESFQYLVNKYGVKLVNNPYYLSRNNNSSIYVAREYLKNSYICSSDNYFVINPFKNEVEDSFYSSIYVKGDTQEWCISFDENDYINNVIVGGRDSYVMLGHVFWSESFSKKFLEILEPIFEKPETFNKLWETIYIEHLKELPMKIMRFSEDEIIEFDTLDELRIFDSSFVNNSGSSILKEISDKLSIEESKMHNFKTVKDKSTEAVGFSFKVDEKTYVYRYLDRLLEEVK